MCMCEATNRKIISDELWERGGVSERGGGGEGWEGLLKGIFQPFELGGVTRLIRSAVKFWKAGNEKKKFLMIQTHERSLKQISAV